MTTSRFSPARSGRPADPHRTLCQTASMSTTGRESDSAAVAVAGDGGTLASSRTDLLLAAVLFAWVPLVLVLDTSASLTGQRLLGAGTWALLLGVLTRETPLVRAQVAVVVVFATAVEYTFSPLLEVYVYRLDNVPAYVPPGHGLVYLCALVLGRSALFGRFAGPLVAGAVVLGGAYAGWGLFWSERTDVLGAFWYACLLGFLAFGRSRLLYVGAFAIVTYLEIIGTALGTWTWQQYDPTGLVPIGNPPSGAAGGYGWFDLAALLAAPAVLATFRRVPWLATRDRLDAIQRVWVSRARNSSSTSTWLRPLVATALLPPGPGRPSRLVNCPPDSSTMSESAARSHSDTSGSAAISTAPSATNMYDQKSPYARVRQQRRVSSRNPASRPCFSQPPMLEYEKDASARSPTSETLQRVADDSPRPV